MLQSTLVLKNGVVTKFMAKYEPVPRSLIDPIAFTRCSQLWCEKMELLPNLWQNMSLYQDF